MTDKYSMLRIFATRACLFLRIWGSFGQKLISKTQIVVISKSGLIDKVIERTLTFLKMSGLNKIATFSIFDIYNTPDIIKTNEHVVFIVEYLIYLEIEKLIKFSVVIIYGSSWFKSIFSKRICTIKI